MSRRIQFSLRALLVAILAVACYLGGMTAERQRNREVKSLYDDWNASLQEQLNSGMSWVMGDVDKLESLAAEVPAHRKYFRERLVDNMYVACVLMYVACVLYASPLKEEYGVKWSGNLYEEQRKWLRILEE